VWRVEESTGGDGWVQLNVESNIERAADNEGFGFCRFDLPYRFEAASITGPADDDLGIPGDQISGILDVDSECDFYNRFEEDESPEVTPPVISPETISRNNTGTRLARPGVLGAATSAPSMCPFLVDFMQMGIENDKMEVTKLQIFLNVFRGMFGGTENPIDGVFGATTDANVKAFQEHFKAEVLTPWFTRGIVPNDRPTGFVYKTTLWKINSIVCPDYAILPDFTGEDLTTNVDLAE
jgi:hypothetical protein